MQMQQTRIDQRVAFLIDTQNMYHSAKHIHGARLNFGRAVDLVADHRPIIRAIAYVAKSKSGEEQGFFDALQNAGIELKSKDVQEFASGAKKADWDVGMAVDAVKLGEKVDVIVLMTGDGDFVPLVEYLHGRGVIVEVAAFAESTNAELKDVCDRFFDISSEGEELLMGGRYRRGMAPRDRHVADELEDIPVMQKVEKLPKPVQKVPAVEPAKKAKSKPAKKDSDEGDDTRKIRVTF